MCVVGIVDTSLLARVHCYIHGMDDNTNRKGNDMKGTTPLRLGEYLRYSRLGGRAKQGLITVKEQKRKNRQVAEHEGGEVVASFEDQNRSGGNMDRAAFQRALAAVQEGAIDGIVVATPDRFSRDMADALQTIKEIESVGGVLLSHQAGGAPIRLSMKNGQDTIMSTMLFLQGHLERQRKREYADDAVRSAIERGVHLGEPFGYERPGKGQRLIVCERERATVKLAYTMRAAGHSWPKIAKTLNEQGEPPRGGKGWRPNTVGRMVKAKVYMGIAHSGARETFDAHEAIITPKLWKEANRAKGVKHDRPKEGYLLTGLVRCASCGYVMPNNEHVSGRRYYRCKPAQNGGVCTAPACANAVELDEWITEEFRKEFLEIDLTALPTDEAVTEAAERTEAARGMLDRAMARFAKLTDLDPAEEQMIEEKLDEARAAFRSAQAAEKKVRHEAKGVDLPADLSADSFAEAPVDEQRHLLALTMAAVVVRPSATWREPVANRVRIISREEAPADPRELIPFVEGLAR